MINSYKDLIVWQKSKELAVDLYRITEDFPRSELYGLVSQMRRASVSISSNIAEGYRRFHSKEKKQFLCVAFGSGAELESQIEIAKELFPNIDYSKVGKLLDEVMRILNTLINKS